MRSRVYETVRRPSVRPSVRPVDRQQHRRAAGLLLSAVRAEDTDRLLLGAAAANAGSVMLAAEVGGGG